MARRISKSVREQRRKDREAAQRRFSPKQGGRFGSSERAARDSPLLSDPSRKTVEQLRRERSGLSSSDLARQQASQQSLLRKEREAEQLQFALRQAQGSSGEQRTADPIASSLATTPGNQAKVRGIAARLNQTLGDIARMREQQGAQTSTTRQGAFDIPNPAGQNITPLGLGVTQARPDSVQGPIAPTGKEGPLRDAAEGFAAPFFNLGKVFAAAPEAVRKDVERFQKTGELPKFKNPIDSIFNPESTQKASAGEQFFQREVSKTLTPTVVDSAISGKPTGRSPTFDLFSGIGEVAVIAAPLAGGKVPKPILNLFGKTPKPVKPATSASVASSTPKPKPQTLRRGPGQNVFVFDTAEPSFVRTLVSLGKGTAKTPEGGSLPSLTFGKSPPGGKSKPRTFQDPKPKSGERIVRGKDGLFQIQKTKTIEQIAKQTTKQKTKQSQFSKTTLNLGKAKVTKQKTKSQILTEQFFRQQSRSARKRRQDAIVSFDNFFGQKQTPKQNSRLETAQPTKQKQRTKPGLLGIRPIQGTKQRTINTPILNTAQKQSFVPIVPTTTINTFVNPAREPPIPPRFFIGLPPFIPGGSGSGDPFGGGGRFGKRFLISNLDPLRAGVISAANVPDLLSGSSEMVFEKGEKALAKERKRQGIDNTIGGILSNPLRGFTEPKRKPKKAKKKTVKKKKKR